MIRIGIDIGGTFTDFAAWKRRGGEDTLISLKVPSTPPDFATGFREGMETVLGVLEPEEGEKVVVMHGTTVSTNLVIERAGPTIALLVTDGFRDLLELQRLRLRNPLDMFETRVKPLVPRKLVYEIGERLNHDGSVRRALDVAGAVAAAESAVAAGASAIGIAFHHAYRNPVHEEAAARAIRARFPELEISLSSAVWPRIGEYERAVVCLLNAYVKSRMSDYLGEIDAYLHDRLPGQRLFISRSNGGAMAAHDAAAMPVHTLLSGPASGVTAAQFLGRARGEARILTLDMGGTSTDLSLIQDGRPTISNDAEVGDFPLMMPVTGIEAIGAGGGSIIWMDGPVLRVGPMSAGARPGPAAFGRGGTRPTLTDAYLLSGYVDPARFLGGEMTLDTEAARRAMKPVADELGIDVVAAAQAAITVATSNMVSSVLPYLARYGVDPEDVTLVLFGGAGALHGPLLAREIGITRILVPAAPSVFCAYGGLVSELVHDTIATVHGEPLDGPALAATLADLTARADDWLAAQAAADELTGTLTETWAEMRYAGQSFSIDVLLPDAALAGDLAAVEATFHAEHKRLYGHCEPSAPVAIVELRVRIRGAMAEPRADLGAIWVGARAQDAASSRPMHWDGGMAETPVASRMALAGGVRLQGPAIIDENDTTILVPPGYAATADASGDLVITLKV